MQWFFETLHAEVKYGMLGKLLYQEKTEHQDLNIYQNPIFGKVLLLDGIIQLAEKDEFIYHEMMVHPIMLAHPNPKKVLVIGGGDGGILREVLKHKSVEEIDFVEIDSSIIDLAKKYFPKVNAGAFNNKKVTTIIADGSKYVAEVKKKYDVVIVDSSDPLGPSKVLFAKTFYKNIDNILNANGLFIRQTGCLFVQNKEFSSQYKILKTIFPLVNTQLVSIPTYTGGPFSFIIGAKTIDIEQLNKKRLLEKYKKIKTNYYNPEIHFASLASPNYVKKLLGK